jgi:hypothetical protein
MTKLDKRRRKHPLFGIGGGAVLAAVAALPAAAQDITNLDRIAQLEARVVELENRRAAGGLRMSPNTKLTFYGYAKADFIYDRNHRLGDLTFGILGIDTNTPERSGSTVHARQSRLGFITRTETGLGELTTRVEGDFFGSGNAFRLRHAYGELNGFLVGQSWNLFMPIESYPTTLDFMGPAGMPFARVAQFRYTHEISADTTLAVSLERDPAGYRTPILTGAASHNFGGSFVKIAALGRRIDHVGGTTNAWGINVSGNAPLWQGGRIQGAYTEGRGIGSIMVFGNDAGLGDPNRTATDHTGAAGGFRAARARGLALGITHDVTDQFTAGLVLGQRRNGSNPSASAFDTERLSSVHATLTYRPIENVMTGVEVIYNQRRQYDGGQVDNTRLQVSTQFSF